MRFNKWFPDDQWGFGTIDIKKRTYIINTDIWKILQWNYFVKGFDLCSLENINTFGEKLIICYKFEEGGYFI